MQARLVSVFATLALCARLCAVTSGVEVPDGERRFDSVGFVLLIGADGRTCDGKPGSGAGYFFQGSCVLVGPQTVALARHELAFGQNPETYWPLETIRIRFRRAADGRSQNHYIGADPTGQDSSCHGVYQERRVIARTVLPADPVWDAQSSPQMALLTLDAPLVGIEPTPFCDGCMPFGSDCAHHFRLVGWGDIRQNFYPQCPDSTPPGSGVLRYGDLDSVIVLHPKTLSEQGWRLGPLDSFGNWANRCQPSEDFQCCRFPLGAVAPARHDSGAGVFVERAAVVDGRTIVETRLFGLVIESGLYAGGWTAENYNTWAAAHRAPGVPTKGFTSPAACCDVNGDGVTGLEDWFTFLNGYFTRTCAGDINRDGAWSIQDIFEFLIHYLGGC